MLAALGACGCQKPPIGGPNMEEIQAMRPDRSVPGHEMIPDPLDTLKLTKADIDMMYAETLDRLHNDITEAKLAKEQLKIRMTDDYIEIVEEMLEQQAAERPKEK